MPLVQVKYPIRSLFRPEFKLPVLEYWLVPGEILLKPWENGLMAFVAVEAPDEFQKAEIRISSFLEICALGALYAPTAANPSSNPLGSIQEIGKNTLTLSIRASFEYSDEQFKALTPSYIEFLEHSKALYAKYGKTLERTSFIGNAAAYYHRSRSTESTLDRKFVDAAIALEYLFNESPNDIAYKIAARSSVLLSLVGEKPTKVFDEMKRLYKIRNRLVHGGSASLDYADLTDIQHYARSSIVCFCLLCTGNSRSKENLIKELDYLVVDAGLKESYRDELKTFVEFDMRGSSEIEGKWKLSW